MGKHAFNPCPDHPERERRMFLVEGRWVLDEVCGPCRTRIEVAARKAERAAARCWCGQAKATLPHVMPYDHTE